MEDIRKFVQEFAEQSYKVLPDHVGAWIVEYFLAKHGIVFDGKNSAEIDPDDIGEPKLCFYNSAYLVQKYPGWKYFEGLIFIDRIPIPIHHAWCLNENNQLVEPTIMDNKSLKYIGIEIPLNEYAAETSSLNTSVFDTGIGRNIPYFLNKDPDLKNMVSEKVLNTIEQFGLRVKNRLKKQENQELNEIIPFYGDK
jgi:hypothetical protein